MPNIVGLEERGIQAYLATSDFSRRTEYYPANLFQYDSEKDHYICPQGQILPLTTRRKTEQVFLYRAKASVCNACPVKTKCTGSKSGRHIFRSFFQEYLDKAEGYRQMEAYLKAIRKRSVWVEPLFGEAKEFHGLRRFRLRRLRKVNLEGVMVAAGQNLKRLIQHHLAKLFSFLTFLSQCFISPLILTFSTGCLILRRIFTVNLDHQVTSSRACASIPLRHYHHLYPCYNRSNDLPNLLGKNYADYQVDWRAPSTFPRAECICPISM